MINTTNGDEDEREKKIMMNETMKAQQEGQSRVEKKKINIRM